MDTHPLMTDAPRATTIVEAQTAAVAKDAKKLARGIAIGFFAAAVLSGGGIAIAAAGVDTDYMIWGPILCFTLIGVLPSLVLGSIVMHDVKMAKRLVRAGAAHRGTIVRDVSLSYKTLHIVDVRWEDGGRSHAARFTIPEIELAGNEEVTVLAIPTDNQVAATFGDRSVFVGRRIRP